MDCFVDGLSGYIKTPLRRASFGSILASSARFRVAINPRKLPHSRNRTNVILTGKPAFRLAPRAVRSIGLGCEASQARGRSSPVAGVRLSGKQRGFPATSGGSALGLRCSKGGPPPALATNNTELGKSCFVLGRVRRSWLLGSKRDLRGRRLRLVCVCGGRLFCAHRRVNRERAVFGSARAIREGPRIAAALSPRRAEKVFAHASPRDVTILDVTPVVSSSRPSIHAVCLCVCVSPKFLEFT